MEKTYEYYKSNHFDVLFPKLSFSLGIGWFYLENEASKDACTDSKKVCSFDIVKHIDAFLVGHKEASHYVDGSNTLHARGTTMGLEGKPNGVSILGIIEDEVLDG
ncbi:unnamed protein product [Vicia faba]|uniref:Uncharacterized protein n=1 Tax=Vicia faba TaxID=3906 RepID=A0AAV0ZQG2_VICFA|nr:unnamed protein product [Vicia faba]